MPTLTDSLTFNHEGVLWQRSVKSMILGWSTLPIQVDSDHNNLGELNMITEEVMTHNF